MRVVHIIPTAFTYFDDISQAAFSLVENLSYFNVEAEAFTLHYGTVTRIEVAKVRMVAPSRQFKELSPLDTLFDSLGQYDVVHLHCPFLGAAKKILTWKKAHPQVPFLATFYHSLVTPDFFSLGIKWYTLYYLPKIFAAADLVACPDLALFQSSYGRHFLQENGKLVLVDGTSVFLNKDLTLPHNEVQLSMEEIVALKYSLVYNKLAL